MIRYGIGNGNPPVFLPGKFHGQRSLVAYSPWGHKRVRHDWMTKHMIRCNCAWAHARALTHIHTHTHTHVCSLFCSSSILFFLLKPVIQDICNRGQNCVRNLNAFYLLPENHSRIQMATTYGLSYRNTLFWLLGFQNSCGSLRYSVIYVNFNINKSRCADPLREKQWNRDKYLMFNSFIKIKW